MRKTLIAATALLMLATPALAQGYYGGSGYRSYTPNLSPYEQGVQEGEAIGGDVYEYDQIQQMQRQQQQQQQQQYNPPMGVVPYSGGHCTPGLPC